MGAKNVLVTDGGKGSVAAVAGGTVLRLPAYRVRVVDPTGAGDAFSAGVILKLHRRLQRGGRTGDVPAADWKEILLYASACGAVCTTGVGTTTAVDSAKVEALVKRRGGGLAAAATVAARG
jgi:sugar/nucleoside kinase (ribokinase family)